MPDKSYKTEEGLSVRPSSLDSWQDNHGGKFVSGGRFAAADVDFGRLRTADSPQPALREQHRHHERARARLFGEHPVTTHRCHPRRPLSNPAQAFKGFQTCSSTGDYGSCLSSTDASICNCNNGMQYLDCVSAAIATSSCEGAVGISGRHRRGRRRPGS